MDPSREISGAVKARQTSGVTTALIVRFVRSVGGDEALERVLARAGERRPPEVLEDETGWSTYEEKTSLLEAAAAVLGDPDVGRHIGETALDHRVGSAIKLILRAMGTPRRVLRRIVDVSGRFSTVHKLDTLALTSTSAVIESRLDPSCTPSRLDCDYTAGLLSQIPVLFGLAPAEVEHQTCAASGDECCVFHLRWRNRSRLMLGKKRRIAHLEEQLRTIRDRADALQSTTADLVSGSETVGVLERIAERAAAAVGAEAFLLAVRTSDSSPLHIEQDGLDEREARRIAANLLDGGSEPTPHLVADVVSARRNYGKIAALNPRGGRFFDSELDMLSTYAKHAAAALDTVTLLQEAERQNQTSTVLLNLARALSESTSIEEVSVRIAEAIPTVIGARSVGVLMWDERERALKLAHRFDPVSGGTHGDDLCIRADETPLVMEMLSSREPRELDTSEVGSELVGLLQGDSIERVSAVPVWVRNKPFALLAMDLSVPSGSLDPSVMEERLRSLAGQAAKAYENVLLIHKERDRAERLLGQKEILEMVATGAPLRETLDSLSSMVEEQIEDARCAVFLLDGQGRTLQTVSAPNLTTDLTWALNGMIPGPASASAGTAAHLGRPVFVDDVSAAPQWSGYREIAAEHSIVSAWSVPVRAAGSHEVLGCVSAYLERSGLPTEQDRHYMELAAQLAAIAIERNRLEEKLTHQAFHDSLTGLPNRALLADRLQHALDRASRLSESLAVLLVDLDNFKSVNDSLGHAAGDQLLKVAADRLTACLRPIDTAARLGGDEFAVLLEGTDKRTVSQIAERILVALREPLLLHGTELTISGSVGIAFSTDGNHKAPDLLRNSDTAMYAAKDAGKGRFKVFEEEMHSGIVRRLQVQNELQRAVEKGEIVTYYQPVYRLDPLEIVGVEALVRWRHPTKGLVPPGDFIPMAEETGLIVPMGLEVLDQTCATLKMWSQVVQRDEPLRGGVNFSARQLQAPLLTEEIAAAIERHGISAEMLIVEITESSLLADPDEIAARLEQLRAMGVNVAIDDFGTGYSSLSYLRRFPVNILKIDKYFVSGMDAGPDASAYARAIVQLGHSLGLDVVAEGVETEAELAILTETGCDFAQGFLFAKPAPAEDVTARFMEQRPEAERSPA